jgi:4-amino-4-deoxy-L-arabinose transferase-like glycosyltransferase
MKAKTNYFLAALLLCAAALSFLLSFVYSVYKNKTEIAGLIAPVIVNIETAKPYISNYGIIAEPGKQSYDLAPTGPIQNELQNVVVYTEIQEKFIQEIFVICYGKEDAVGAIDNITIFIGNKTYYFPKSKIETWKQQETEDGILLRLPVEPYAKSIIKPWINWYGDLNFALKGMTGFLINPLSFPATILFILMAAALLWTEIKTIFSSLRKKNDRRLEIIMLLALLVFAFLLRINGLTRHSSWIDELYSSTRAANPHLPLLNAFKDPGNPPLFFLLLRLWYEIFGWSEASGRLLSVVIGTVGILSLYLFVKSMCGIKCALLAAFFLSINQSHIGFSNEARAYILQMTLVPLVSLFFFGLLKKGGFKNYALYILAGVAIVNTHYYGVLLILFNFIYYIIINRKQLFAGKTIVFFIANVVIALSLLPFFIITAFQKTLMDSSFNTWIQKPGKVLYLAFIMFLCVCIMFPIVKRRSTTTKNISAQSGGLLDYAVYAGSFIFISAFLISLKRPILVWRYLSICLPLLISIAPLAVFYIKRCIKPEIPGRFVSVLASIMLIPILYEFARFGGGANDVYKEAQEYICADVAAHSLKAAELKSYNRDYSSYYGLVEIEPFSHGKNYDVVYINPLHNDESGVSLILTSAGLDGRDVLKIRTSNGKYIWKKYL